VNEESKDATKMPGRAAIVLMLIWRPRKPAFFRGETLRHDTPALIVPE
jgi:hypothetical protein